MAERALSPAQVQRFTERGALLVEGFIDAEELQALAAALPAELADTSARRILEKDGTTVRSVYGSHRHDAAFARLARHPRLVAAAQELLGSEVYVYQYKINAKAAFGGDIWEWHQDFIYWEREDGLRRPDIINFGICLDEVTPFNGPLFVVPGSQQLGVVPPAAPPDITKDRRQPYREQPAWIANLIAKLKYAIDQPTLKDLVDRYGLETIYGPRGSLIIFHSNVVHSSPPNISPYPRTMVVITYCRADNLPHPPATRRPWFLCPEDYTPVTPR